MKHFFKENAVSLLFLLLLFLLTILWGRMIAKEIRRNTYIANLPAAKAQAACFSGGNDR